MKHELLAKGVEQASRATPEKRPAFSEGSHTEQIRVEVAQAYHQALEEREVDKRLVHEVAEASSTKEAHALLQQLKELDRKSFQEIAAFVRESELLSTRRDRHAFLERITNDHPSELGAVVSALRLSTNEVFDFLLAQSEIHRESVQSGLEDIGIKGKAFPPEARHEEPSKREAERELLQQAERIEQELLTALIAVAPERAEIEAKRSLIEQGLRGEIAYQYELNAGSSSAPLAVLYKNQGPVGVYKPQVREPGFPEGSPLRSGIKPGEGIYREWVTGLIGKALQVDVVPATILRIGSEGIGSVKEWIPGESAVFATDETVDRASLEEMAVLHAAITHCDGGQRNIHIRDQDGRAFSIDNDLCLSETPEMLFSGLQSDAVARFQDKPLSKKRVDALLSLVESKPMMQALEQSFTLAFKDAAPTIWKQFVNTLWSMVPDDPSESVYLPKLQAQPRWGA